MTLFRKFSDAVYFIERILAIVLLGSMVTVIMLGVISRYFLNSPLTWSDEFALFCLVWVTFVGGSMSIKKKKAAAVTLLIERIPARISRVLLVLSALFALLFSVYILYLSMKWITNPAILLQKSTAMGLPMFIPYVAIPLGFLFLSIHLLEQLVGAFQNIKSEGAK
jgi:TRAP-type C4-dicarboxylate transport system permease small subunit